jgi:hypothetical protein
MSTAQARSERDLPPNPATEFASHVPGSSDDVRTWRLRWTGFLSISWSRLDGKTGDEQQRQSTRQLGPTIGVVANDRRPRSSGLAQGPGCHA